MPYTLQHCLYRQKECITYFDNERKYYLPYYCQKNANILKFNQLFSSHNIVVLEKLCKFIKVITVKVSPPG